MMVYTEAKAWMERELLSGPRQVNELMRRAKADGMSMSCFTRLRKDLGVECFVQPGMRSGPWYLGLPPDYIEKLADRGASESLLAGLRERGEPAEAWPMDRVVEWVSEHRLYRPVDLRVEDIPSVRALDLLLWAREKPAEFRRLYESKLMARPVSLAGKGGRPVDPGRSERSRNARHDSAVDDLLRDAKREAG